MNDNPKFTPGPWRSEGPDEFGDHNIIPPDARLAVAAVVSNLRPAEEVAANACLVAAAPELCEALKAALSHLHDIDSKLQRESHEQGDRYYGLPALRKAEEALDKAEGRS